MTRENFSFRISNYYLEHSIFMIGDMLFNKIETSRNFVKKLRLNYMLYHRLFQKNLSRHFRLFGEITNKPRLVGLDNILNNSIDIQTFLFNCMSAKYPKIKFNKILEPVYQNRLIKRNVESMLFTNRRTELLMWKDNIKVYKSLSIPEGLSIKYSDDELVKRQVNIEQRLILNNCYITKWILHNDKLLYNENNNYIKLCNLTISSMTKFNYDDLKDYLTIPIGGEIFHRLDNFAFKNKSYIKSLHPYVLLNNVHLNHYSVICTYADSNINFSLVKDIIKLKSAIKEYLFGTITLITDYGFKYMNNIIRTVRTNLSYNTSQTYRELYGLRTQNINIIDSIEQFTVLNKILSTDNLLITRDLNINNYLESRLTKDIVNNHLAITNSNVWCDFVISPDQIWRKFYDSMKFNYDMLNRMSYSEFKSMAVNKITEYYQEMRNLRLVNMESIYRILKLEDTEELVERKMTLLSNYLQSNTRQLVKIRRQMRSKNMSWQELDNLNSIYKYTESKIKNELSQANNNVKKELYKAVILEVIVKFCLCFDQRAKYGVKIMIDRTLRLLRAFF